MFSEKKRLLKNDQIFFLDCKNCKFIILIMAQTESSATKFVYLLIQGGGGISAQNASELHCLVLGGGRLPKFPFISYYMFNGPGVTLLKFLFMRTSPAGVLLKFSLMVLAEFCSNFL